MGNHLHHWVKQSALLMAVESVIAILASYYLSAYVSTLYQFPLPQVGGLWGAYFGSSYPEPQAWRCVTHGNVCVFWVV